jgi:hypothetical protein
MGDVETGSRARQHRRAWPELADELDRPFPMFSKTGWVRDNMTER